MPHTHWCLIREHKLAISPAPHLRSGLWIAPLMRILPPPIRVLLGLQSPQPGAEEKKATGHNETARRPGSSSSFLFSTCCESLGCLLTLSEPVSSFLSCQIPPLPANPMTLAPVLSQVYREQPWPGPQERWNPAHLCHEPAVCPWATVSPSQSLASPVCLCSSQQTSATRWYHLTAGEATARGGRHWKAGHIHSPWLITLASVYCLPNSPSKHLHYRE